MSLIAPDVWRLSPLARLPRVGAIATMPSRLESFRQAFPTIIRQVQRLYVYLDGHKAVPDFIRTPQVLILDRTAKSLGPAGRFLALGREENACVFMTFDDDIRYPVGYADSLVEALVRHGGNVLVGFHGAIYLPPYRSAVTDKRTWHFANALAADLRVDLIGAGTAAFVSTAIPVDPREWIETDHDDVLMSIEAERRGVPRIAIARQANYLSAIAQNQPDGLWTRTLADDSRRSALMRRLIELEMASPGGLPPRP